MVQRTQGSATLVTRETAKEIEKKKTTPFRSYSLTLSICAFFYRFSQCHSLSSRCLAVNHSVLTIVRSFSFLCIIPFCNIDTFFLPLFRFRSHVPRIATFIVIFFYFIDLSLFLFVAINLSSFFTRALRLNTHMLFTFISVRQSGQQPVGYFWSYMAPSR